MIAINIFQKIAKLVPDLASKLRQADIFDTPEYFVKKTITISLFATFGFCLFVWLVLAKLGYGKIALYLAPLVFIVAIVYMSRIPDARIMKKQKEISSEIVFAGRFLIIELQSGVPLYNAFRNISKNYPAIGKYFAEITTKIDLGTQMEAALNEAIEFTPSPQFRKILWQIVNAQHTGADISQALKSVVNQISQEQMIEVKDYGRKLNPLAMFYMILAVILPSIGITMFIIMSTFMNWTLPLSNLLVLSLFLGFMQFMFLAMIKSNRPAVEM